MYYQTKIWLFKNLILRDKSWAKGKAALLRKLAVLGRRWTQVPKNFHSPCLLRFYRERGYMQGKGQSSIFRNNCLNRVIPSSHRVLLTEGTMNALQLRHESLVN